MFIGDVAAIRAEYEKFLFLYPSELVGCVSMSNLSVWLGFIALTHSKLR